MGGVHSATHLTQRAARLFGPQRATLEVDADDAHGLERSRLWRGVRVAPDCQGRGHGHQGSRDRLGAEGVQEFGPTGLVYFAAAEWREKRVVRAALQELVATRRF